MGVKQAYMGVKQVTLRTNRATLGLTGFLKAGKKAGKTKKGGPQVGNFYMVVYFLLQFISN